MSTAEHMRDCVELLSAVFRLPIIHVLFRCCSLNFPSVHFSAMMANNLNKAPVMMTMELQAPVLTRHEENVVVCGGFSSELEGDEQIQGKADAVRMMSFKTRHFFFLRNLHFVKVLLS